MDSAGTAPDSQPIDQLSESLEDYLEAILMIEEEKQAARPKDIARRLSVSAPSVTGALRNLAVHGLVNYAPYDLVTLSAHGRRIAVDVRRRHVALHRFLTDLLKIDEEEADEIACRMEHALPPHVLTRLVAFMDFVDDCPWCELSWSPTGGFERKREESLAEAERLVESPGSDTEENG